MGHVEQRIVGVERRTQVVISSKLVTMMMTKHDVTDLVTHLQCIVRPSQ